MVNNRASELTPDDGGLGSTRQINHEVCGNICISFCTKSNLYGVA